MQIRRVDDAKLRPSQTRHPQRVPSNGRKSSTEHGMTAAQRSLGSHNDTWDRTTTLGIAFDHAPNKCRGPPTNRVLGSKHAYYLVAAKYPLRSRHHCGSRLSVAPFRRAFPSRLSVASFRGVFPSRPIRLPVTLTGSPPNRAGETELSEQAHGIHVDTHSHHAIWGRPSDG